MSNESSPPKGDTAEKHEETKPEAARAPEPAKEVAPAETVTTAAAAPAEAAAPAGAPEATEKEDDGPSVEVTVEESAEEPPAEEPPAEAKPAEAPPAARPPSAPPQASAASKPPSAAPQASAASRPPSMPPQASITSQLPPRLWPPQVVADIMARKVITLGADAPIGQLEAWMERFRFRHLPVVDARGKLVGLITRVDLLHAVLGRGPDGKPIPNISAETPASAIMNRNVVTAQLDAPLATAGRVMLKEKLGCLPVLRDDGVLVGIVTMTDFAHLGVELLERSA